MQAHIRFGLALTMLLSLGMTAAQTKNGLSDQVIQDQMSRSREIMRRVSPAQAAQSMPNIATPSATGLDPADMVKRYNAMQQATKPKDEGLVVFVSMSMPSASLNRLIDESAQHGFPLVMRGLVGDSWRETQEVMAKLIGNRNAQIQIDPRLYTRFAIKSVPAIVVVSSASSRYATVEGDVSVAYALDKISNSRSVVAPLAKHFLKRFEP